MPFNRDPFDEALDLAGGLMAKAGLGLVESRPGAWSPPIDIFETDGALFIKAEIPGVPPEELRVEVQGRRLLIAGDRGPADSARRYHHLERMAGPFERSFTLPANLAPELIEARCHEGVLEIRLPKRQDKRSRQIEIKSP